MGCGYHEREKKRYELPAAPGPNMFVWYASWHISPLNTMCPPGYTNNPDTWRMAANIDDCTYADHLVWRALGVRCVRAPQTHLAPRGPGRGLLCTE